MTRIRTRVEESPRACGESVQIRLASVRAHGPTSGRGGARRGDRTDVRSGLGRRSPPAVGRCVPRDLVVRSRRRRRVSPTASCCAAIRASTAASPTAPPNTCCVRPPRRPASRSPACGRCCGPRTASAAASSWIASRARRFPGGSSATTPTPTARPRLAAQCGEIAARIHAIDPDTLPRLPTHGAATQIDQYRTLLDTFGEPHPAFELGLRWLAERIPPAPARAELVHGDFRNGNFIVGPEGIRAVLDWELAHLGDPVEDLGWLCVKSWRFGVGRQARRRVRRRRRSPRRIRGRGRTARRRGRRCGSGSRSGTLQLGRDLRRPGVHPSQRPRAFGRARHARPPRRRDRVGPARDPRRRLVKRWPRTGPTPPSSSRPCASSSNTTSWRRRPGACSSTPASRSTRSA